MREFFDFNKTLQTTALLLKKAGGALPRVTLLKLLYLSDRQFLLEYGCTITGDTMYAMKLGPVLTITYNLLKGQDSQFALWRKYIQTQTDSKEKTAFLILDPGTDDLSKAELETIENVFNQFGAQSRFDLVEFTHSFPEWQYFYKEDTSTKISPDQILRINDREDLIETLKENIAIAREQHYLFG